MTLVEPTGYQTDWNGASSVQTDHQPQYENLRANLAEYFGAIRKNPRGDPNATDEAILAVVDSPDPPLRVFFGKGPLEIMKGEYARRLALWQEWDPVSQKAHGNPS